jgi:hypothetical protein
MSSTPTGLHQPATIQQRPLHLQGLFHHEIISVFSGGFKWSLGEFNPFRVEPVYGTPSQGRPIPLCGTGQPWAK